MVAVEEGVSKTAFLQGLCRKSEEWCQALSVGQTREALQRASHGRAQFSEMLSHIEHTSHADYISSALVATGAAPSSRGGGQRAKTTTARATLPVAIPHRSDRSKMRDVDDDFLPEEGLSAYTCSPQDLQRARTMWVPRNLPPAIEVRISRLYASPSALPLAPSRSPSRSLRPFFPGRPPL